MLERNIFHNLIGSHAFTVEAPSVSIAECAEFSSNIYNENPSTPAGWSLLYLHEDASVGYRGAAYARNLLTTNAQVIFAHRGTVLTLRDGISNIIGDIQISLGNTPVQFESVKRLMAHVSEEIRKIYKVYDEHGNIELLKYIRSINTGHSMGAILADCASSLSNTPSITFENPGSKPIVQKILTAMQIPVYAQQEIFNALKTNCCAYQGGVNMINTCNEQVGRTFRITELDYEYKLNSLGVMEFPPNPSYLSNFTYSVDYTIDQHSIVKIVDYFNKGNSTIEITNPIGFQAGYIEYINPTNQKYWDGYFMKIWNSTSPLAKAIHLKYTDIDEFEKHSYQDLMSLYAELTKKRAYETLYSPTFNLFNDKSAHQQKDKMDDLSEFILIEKPEEEEPSTRKYCSVM